MLDKNVLDEPVRGLKKVLDDYAQELTNEQAKGIYDGAVNMHNAMLVCFRGDHVSDDQYESLLDGVCRLHSGITNSRFIRGVSREHQEIAARMAQPVDAVSAAMIVDRYVNEMQGSENE